MARWDLVAARTVMWPGGLNLEDLDNVARHGMRGGSVRPRARAEIMTRSPDPSGGARAAEWCIFEHARAGEIGGTVRMAK